MKHETQVENHMRSQGYIDKNESIEELERAATAAGHSLEQHISENKGIDIDDVARAMAEAYGVDYTDLDEFELSPELARFLTSVIPNTTNTVIFEVDQKKKRIKVATRTPQDKAHFEFMKERSGMEVDVHVTTPDRLEKAVEQYHNQLLLWLQEYSSSINEKTELSLEEEAAVTHSEPITHILDALIAYAVFRDADEIRLIQQEDLCSVRFIIQAAAIDVMQLPQAVFRPLTSRLEQLAGTERRWKQHINDDTISISLTQEHSDHYRATHLHLHGQKRATRSLEQLELRPDVVRHIRRVVTQPGLTLISGAAGSGRTTTAYTIISEADTMGKHVALVEQRRHHPIEGVTQIDAGIQDVTIADAIDSLEQQSVDLLVIDAVRSKEAAQAAVRMARRGIAVVAVTTGRGAEETIWQWTQWMEEPAEFAAAARLVITQALIGGLNIESRRSATLAEEVQKELEESEALQNVLTRLKRQDKIAQEVSIREMHFFQDDEPQPTTLIPITDCVDIQTTLQRAISTKDRTIIHEEVERNELSMLSDAFIKARTGIVDFNDFHRITNNNIRSSS